MSNVFAFLFVLGVLVFVHELGHFVMARLNGVRVLTFSLGFGPKLLATTRHGTEYCISAIPLGGYVKMAGETAEDPRSGAPDEFLSKTKWQRFQVLIMGPLMNLVLAVVLLTGVFYTGAEVPAYESQPPVVGRVVEKSPAEESGIRPGDVILRVADRDVDTWEQLFIAVTPRAGKDIPIVVRRGGEELSLRVVPESQTKYELGEIGVLPEVHPQVRGVTPGDPAALAGLQAGDVILALDREPVTDSQALVKSINGSAGKTLTLTVRRAGTPVDLQVTPVKRGDVGRIGVDLSGYETRLIQPGFFQAIQMSLKRNLELTRAIFDTLRGLFTAETSPKQLMGPLGIAQLSGGAFQLGWSALFSLMAMISLNLGLINLMPIPVLDGGHIAIMALEGVSGRDFSVRVKERMLLAGFVVLMALMVTVIYNDLTRITWVERLMPWR
ncbi:MAG: RIP metalloprotease RseP [Vicinamibacterales bacterium]